MRRYITLAILFALTSSAGAALTASSSVDEVLDALQASGKNLKSFSADVKHIKTDMTGQDVTDAGKVIYQTQPGKDIRARISFETEQMAKKAPKPAKMLYQLDNGWLTRRDWAAKTELLKQLVPPGQKIDLFDLDKTPFPLPLGQQKSVVLAQFEVTKIPLAKDEPANTIHLKLKPKPNTKLAGKYSALELFVDPAKAMPVRIDTDDVRHSDSTSTLFENMTVDPALSDADFALPVLPTKDWRQDVQALK